MLQSIDDTTGNKNEIEVVIAYDFDDSITSSITKELESKYKDINLRFIGRDRSAYTTNDYYNWLAMNHSTGEFLIFVNDDALFETQKWDIHTYKKLEEYLKDKPDGVVYGIVEDLEVEKKRKKHNYFSCFPLMSRRAINALGFAFDPEFHRDGADWAIIGVYRQLDRILDLREEVTIKHLSYRSFRRKWDEVDDEAQRLSKILTYPEVDAFLQRDVNIFKEYMKQYEEKITNE